MPRVYIGIGSNVERDRNIRSGLEDLTSLGTGMLVSTVYESKAIGFDGDNFYNLAVGFDTELGPDELNDRLREIEDRHGRLRNVPRFSSRTLDLDLLLYGDLVQHTAGLDVPREDIIAYAFVLKPLAEIAADALHPEAGRSIADLYRESGIDETGLWPVSLPDS